MEELEDDRDQHHDIAEDCTVKFTNSFIEPAQVITSFIISRWCLKMILEKKTKK
jgi:hypothetical protein